MKSNLKKKAFAFSIMSFFISIIIFSFGFLFFEDVDLTKGDAFVKSRVSFLGNEIQFFKNSYVNDAAGFSFYNSLNTIMNNRSILLSIEKDHRLLNEVIEDAMVNGIINGSVSSDLENKTLIYFLDIYAENFNRTQRGGFDYKVKDVAVFERNPYYVDVQVLMEVNITTIDNVSQWNFEEIFESSVPIFGINDPEKLLEENLKMPILSIESEKSDSNWSVENLNQTIIWGFGTVYIEPEHRYTLGNSFIKRMLNISYSSYDQNVLFLSFDHDEENLSIYDTSTKNTNVERFDNTKVYLNFDGDVSPSTTDFTDYNNDATISGATFTDVDCLNGGCYELDGIDDDISFNVNISVFGDRFSISLWSKSTDIDAGPNRLMRHHNNIGFGLFTNGGNLILVQNEDSNTAITSENFSNNLWHHIVIIGTETEITMYVDAIRIGTEERVMANPTREQLFIGSDDGTSEYYGGYIDEVNIFSRAITENEIAELYGKRKALFIDYQDSLHRDGLYFDGRDDYIEVGSNSDNDLDDDFTVETWIKPYESTNNATLIDKVDDISDEGFIVKILANSSIISVGNNVNEIRGQLSLNKWNYVTIVSDGSSNMSLYINSLLTNSSVITLSPNTEDILIGKNKNSDEFYFGILDEIKISQKTIDSVNVKNNFYNFEGNSKGCCNFLTLLNPNALDYNTSEYTDNVSYSTKVFYDFHTRNTFPTYDLTLYRLSNFTSDDFNDEYFNFRFDICLMEAYDVFDFDINTQLREGESGSNFCTNLVSEGIY